MIKFSLAVQLSPNLAISLIRNFYVYSILHFILIQCLVCQVQSQPFSTLIPQPINILQSGASVEWMRNAWCGGLNNATFFQADFNLDNKADIIVWDKADHNIGIWLATQSVNQTFVYQYSTSFSYQYARLGFQQWIALLDINCDSIPDILSGTRDSYVSLFMGQQQNGRLVHRLANPAIKYTLQYPNEKPIYPELIVSGLDHNAWIDVDFDGDIDFVANDQSGNQLMLYRNKAQELYQRCDTLALLLENDCWGEFREVYDSTGNMNEYSVELGLSGCNQWNKTSHTGGTLTILDLNRDSLYDALISDSNIDYAIGLINRGTIQAAKFTTAINPLITQDSILVQTPYMPAFSTLDINQDRQLDMIVGPNQTDGSIDKTPLTVLEGLPMQANSPVFNFKTGDITQYFGNWIDLGSSLQPIVHDLNKDGLADILLIASQFDTAQLKAVPSVAVIWNRSKNATESQIYEYDNKTKWTKCLDKWTNSNAESRASLGDLNNDGELDIVVGAKKGKISVLMYGESNGIPEWRVTNDDIFASTSNRTNAAPALFDWDGDGDIDLLIGNGNGTLDFAINSGTKSTPRFTLHTQRVGNISLTDSTSLSNSSVVPVVIDNPCGQGRLLVISRNNGELMAYSFCDNLAQSFPLVGRSKADWQHSGMCFAPFQVKCSDSLAFLVGTKRGGVQTALFGVDSTLFKPCKSTSGIRNTLNVFPNPARDELTIQASQGPISVMDVLGRMMYSDLARNNDNNITLELNNWGAGIYIVILKPETGLTVEKKVIVIR
jgi:hypothetical protein